MGTSHPGKLDVKTEVAREVPGLGYEDGGYCLSPDLPPGTDGHTVCRRATQLQQLS